MEGSSGIVEWGLIFILCVALSWIYLVRDSGRWKTAILGAKDLRKDLELSQQSVALQANTIRSLEKRVDAMAGAIMGSKTLCENLDNKINEQMTTLVKENQLRYDEMLCELKEIDNFQDHVRRVRESLDTVCKNYELLARAQNRLTHNQLYLRGRVEAMQVPFTIKDVPSPKKMGIGPTTEQKKNLNLVKDQLKEF